MNMQIKVAIMITVRKSFFRQYLSHGAWCQKNFGVYPLVLRGKE